MNRNALLALAEAIEDPSVNRPGIRRRRDWAEALRAALDDDAMQDFPEHHSKTCWCNGTGWRDFGYGRVACNMNQAHLREIE